MSENDVSPNDLGEQRTYTLVKKSMLVLTKKVNNGVLQNVTMLGAVSWLLSKSGCSRNVLMSNFTNNESHKELLILPKTLLSQLLFLESEYGWYKEGTCIFFA